MNRAFAADVHDALSLQPRQLPSRYLYDDLGSALFEAICRLPWYPITRAEQRLLEEHGAAILRSVDPAATIIELGSGSGEKLRTLLHAARVGASALDVHLVDLSASALDLSARTLDAFAGLRVATHQAEYQDGLAAALGFRPSGRVLVLFLGSNIGNFDPPECDALLRGMRGALRAGDALLLGADLVKPERELVLAYDDPLGVSAAFNRNVLVRINRELDGNFAVDQFAHRAAWNAGASRMEMRLTACREQVVHIPGADLRFTMAAGETIWTESSYKYREEQLAALIDAAGFRTTAQWVEPRDRFALTLAEAVG